MTPDELKKAIEGLEAAWRNCHYTPQPCLNRVVELVEEDEEPMVRDSQTGEYKPDTNPHSPANRANWYVDDKND